jgi:Protein of unknown function (DUF4239)
MSGWLHSLPLAWMTVLVFGATYAIAFALHKGVAMLSSGAAAQSFKAVSPGMLPPLGILFGLFVAFTAAQVWGDIDRAHAAVNREASALRSIVVLAASFPGEQETRLRNLIRHYIEETTSQEWPRMAMGAATLGTTPPTLDEALRTTLSVMPATPGQEIAQREIARSIEDGLEARRQRVLVSQAEVNFTKWACLVLQAVCALLAIAVVHNDNRLASAIALGTFATGVAASALLILAHDRPFTGEIAVTAEPLLQVMPEATKEGKK